MLRRSLPLRRIGIFPLHLDPPNIDHHRVFLQILNDPKLDLNRLILLPLSHPAVSLSKSLHLAAMSGLCLREFEPAEQSQHSLFTECGKVVTTSSPQAFSGTEEELEETKNSFVSSVGVNTTVDSHETIDVPDPRGTGKTKKQKITKKKPVRVDIKFTALEMHEEKVWVVEQLLRQQFYSNKENAKQYLNSSRPEAVPSSLAETEKLTSQQQQQQQQQQSSEKVTTTTTPNKPSFDKLLQDEDVVLFQWLADVEVGGCLADRLWPRVSAFAPKLPLTLLIPTGPAYPPVDDIATESTINRITSRWAGTVNVFNVRREWSSGYVRRRLFEQEGKCNALVSPSILRYIDSHNLYRDERRPRQRYGAAVAENAMRLPLIAVDDLQASHHHQRHKTSSSSDQSNDGKGNSSSSSSGGNSSLSNKQKGGDIDNSALDDHSAYYDNADDSHRLHQQQNSTNNNTSSQQQTHNSTDQFQSESWDHFPSSSYMMSSTSSKFGANSATRTAANQFYQQDSLHSQHSGAAKADPSSKWVSYAGTIPKLELHFDPRNSLARHIYEQLKTFQVRPGEHPDLIVPIGGDGYLMKCVRRFWSRFIPFFGVNAGHVGFLLNDAALLEEFFLAPLRLYQVSMLYCVAENLPPENEYQQKEMMMRRQFALQKQEELRQQAVAAAKLKSQNRMKEAIYSSPSSTSATDINIEDSDTEEDLLLGGANAMLDLSSVVNAAASSPPVGPASPSGLASTSSTSLGDNVLSSMTDASNFGTAGPCSSRTDPGIVRAFAFNDAWMERATGQTAKFRIAVNGVERSRSVRGDGVLVSTASGSTAYAQALGGSPMPIDTPILQLVGSNCTWPVRWRPVHLPEDVLIELESLDSEKRPCRAYVDSVDLGLIKRLTIRASRVAGVQLAFTRSSDVQAKLYKMQFPEQ